MTVLAAVAVLTGIVTAALVALLVWAEHRQVVYRRRLSRSPMHVHDGRPCFGEACRPVREEVSA